MIVSRIGCGRVVAFRVRGHTGVNTIRVRRTLDGKRLPDGTYRIRGRSHGRTVFRATLVVGRGGTAPCTIAAVASQLATVFGGGSTVGGTPAASARRAWAPAGQSSGKLAVGKIRDAPTKGSGVLAASKVLPGNGRTPLRLLIVLAAAIVLLALGTLPHEVVPHPAVAAFLARRRVLIAAAGLSALLGFVVAYFMT